MKLRQDAPDHLTLTLVSRYTDWGIWACRPTLYGIPALPVLSSNEWHLVNMANLYGMQAVGPSMLAVKALRL